MLRRELIPPLLLLLVPLCLLAGVFIGSQSWSWLWQSGTGQMVLWQIRMPRVLLAFLIGAVLAWAGVLIQGVVRNPLADPGLIGVSGGAAVGAALYLALASHWPVALQTLFAFSGAWLALLLVLRLGLSGASLHAMSFLILAGIAVNVMASAVIGLLSYLASDSALRQITFWSLGSLSGANWSWVAALTAVLLAALWYWPKRLRQLDALLLGETEARSLGVNVAQLQGRTVVWVALMISVAVSASGIIGFVGLVSPHIARLLVGAAHRRVLPVAVVLGGCLMVLADAVARALIAPAELPIGIVTSLLGAPVFISLLLREKRRLSW
ncbi:iron ABC transporter permease [Bacterioplanes sanyensis]|uniref:FecCD family ABC transporter permease n=1 Tax=Bacterioplanes sanyensis TaxID=1249553 RepID=UPI00167A3432|nr:iron ABC transporter permease [Bacterioplanes sanyensis]GGY38832.1 iron ABC transporter permease [Bacterioplanes sanyensis]